jgi:hypothetical protein
MNNTTEHETENGGRVASNGGLGKWITNAFLQDVTNYDYAHNVLSTPMKTEKYTVSELTEMGVVGIYIPYD